MSNPNVAYIYELDIEHEVPAAGGDAFSLDQTSDSV